MTAPTRSQADIATLFGERQRRNDARMIGDGQMYRAADWGACEMTGPNHQQDSWQQQNRPPQHQPYPPQPPVPPQPAKRKRRWVWVLSGIIALIVVIAIASGKPPSTGPSGVQIGNEATGKASASASTPNTHTVVYSVTGTARAVNITYNTDGQTTENDEQGQSLPWSKTITLPADQSFEMAQILAQGTMETGHLTVTITVDGKVVKQASANGYGVASANVQIGD